MTDRPDSALDFLYSRVDFERTPSIPYQAHGFKLDRMRELLARLGNPQDRLPIIHVAGTKGKGSTAAMIGSVLQRSGFRTGLFTSPHLDRIEERIIVAKDPCPADALARLLAEVRPVVETLDREAAGGGATFFEIVTAVALLHFVRQGVEAAVLEVGLGGRLDATNVCTPRAAVITSVSLDHTRQLGDTLAQIAREKAGIVKPGRPVISGVVPEEPRAVVRQVCRQQGAPLVELGRDFHFDYRPPRHLEQAPAPGSLDFHYQGPHGRRQCPNLALGLAGRHQAANAALALATLEELRGQGWRIPLEAARAGLAELSWPARVEVVGRRPAIVVDGAHNVASVEALVESLDESFSVRRRHLLFATTRDKDLSGMLALLLPRFDEVLFTQYANNPRAVPAEEVAAAAAQLTGRNHPFEPDARAAWEGLRRRAAPEDLLCATGSFYLAAEIRRLVS